MKIENFYDCKSFWQFLRITGKYDELYTKKGIVCAVLALLFSILLCLVYSYSFQNYTEFLIIALPGLAWSALTILGFIISGLALVSGTVSNKLIAKVDGMSKAQNLVGLLFSFCFAGALAIFLFFICSFAYVGQLVIRSMEISPSLLVDKVILLIVSTVIAYTAFFLVIYCMVLLITCIRLFLLSYCYDEKVQ